MSILSTDSLPQFNILTEFTNGKIMTSNIRRFHLTYCIGKVFAEATYLDELDKIGAIDIELQTGDLLCQNNCQN